MQRRIAFLLGKKPRPGTIVAEVIDLLATRDVRSEVLLPHDQQVGAEDAQDVDLVVHRGLSGPDADLLSSLDALSTPLCNPWRGMRHLHDRAALHDALDGAGVPSPRGVVRTTWADVLAEERRRRVVVKAVEGPGRGRGVLPSPLPEDPPMDGPYLVEELIEHDGTDHKLYVAGDRVSGLLKPSTLTHGHSTEGTPFEVSTELAGLARRTLQHLGLHLAGVDVVIGPDGPVVVDVNAFPGYRGVEGAAAAVAEHLVDHLA
jgi:ribosomal protein S6--L-glutamate ligase